MQQSATRPGPSRQRPMSVTILAVLAGIAGVGTVLGVLAGALVIHGIDSLGATDAAIVLPALALSGMYFVFAYAAWTLKPWGWTLGVVAAAATILYTTVVLVGGWGELMRDAPPLAVAGVLVIVIAAVGLITGFQQEVKAAFPRR